MSSSSVRVSLNEKKFIEAALRVEQRVDGRRPFDARRLLISFSKEDGAVEVQQGETRVMAVASAQLAAPYPDRPNEGSMAIFTEFSPMADPAFEPGRPGELAVELGRIVDRGLRESSAVDTESLCVLAGRAVWAIRLDLHVLDNGGNLVDVANVAALAALLSFRRPECSLGGHDGQEVIVHPPEVREPLPLSIHHLPIAVTFAFLGDGDLVVVDPSLKEEAIMGGRLTVTVNAHGEVCAVQKGGGIGVGSSEVMRCLRIAMTKAADVTDTLKKAVEAHEIERRQRKLRRHRKVEPHTTSEVSFQQAGKDVEMIDGDEKVAVLSEEQRLVQSCKEIIKARGEDESIADMDGGIVSSDSEEDLEIRKAVLGRPKKAKLNTREGGQDFTREGVSQVQAAEPSKPTTTLWNVAPVDVDDAEAANDVDELLKSITQQAPGAPRTAEDTAFGKGSSAAAAVYSSLRKDRAQEPSRPLGPIFPIMGSALPTKQASDADVAGLPNAGAAKEKKKRKKNRGSQGGKQ